MDEETPDKDWLKELINNPLPPEHTLDDALIMMEESWLHWKGLLEKYGLKHEENQKFIDIFNEDMKLSFNLGLVMGHYAACGMVVRKFLGRDPGVNEHVRAKQLVEDRKNKK